jgi:hypothetical protein
VKLAVIDVEVGRVVVVVKHLDQNAEEDRQYRHVSPLSTYGIDASASDQAELVEGYCPRKGDGVPGSEWVAKR